MLRICDILVRIRIRRFVPLTNGSGPCYFRHWPSRRQKNYLSFSAYYFLKVHFHHAYYFLKVHFHHFSKIKSQKEVTKHFQNQGFSYHFCLILEGSGSGPLTTRSGRPKNIGSGTLLTGLDSGCPLYLMKVWWCPPLGWVPARPVSSCRPPHARKHHPLHTTNVPYPFRHEWKECRGLNWSLKSVTDPARLQRICCFLRKWQGVHENTGEQKKVMLHYDRCN